MLTDDIAIPFKRKFPLLIIPFSLIFFLEMEKKKIAKIKNTKMPAIFKAAITFGFSMRNSAKYKAIPA